MSASDNEVLAREIATTRAILFITFLLLKACDVELISHFSLIAALSKKNILFSANEYVNKKKSI